SLSVELLSRLKELSGREGATLFMTVLVAFKALLGKYSGQDDLVVGASVANRKRKEVEGLIGFFVNLLAIRTDAGAHPTIREFLRRTRKAALEAYDNQDAPFERVLEAVKIDKDPNRTPLFQVLFQLQNTPQEHIRLRNLDVSFVDYDRGTSKYDLVANLSEN